MKRSGSSFYYGMRMLPPDRRAAVYSIYAFCRVVDDIADEPGALVAKREALDGWRERIARIWPRAAPMMALTRLLLRARRANTISRPGFPGDHRRHADGCRARDRRARPLATLDLYCDRVASAVGRLSVRAFGDASAWHADRVAYCLGRALQLTNILRDIAEDAERSRLYLPREWLAEEGVPPNPARGAELAGLAAPLRSVSRHWRATIIAVPRRRWRNATSGRSSRRG